MSFKPGDICIGVGFRNWVQNNGMECVVLTPIANVHTIDPRTNELSFGPNHKVQWADGREVWVSPLRLRLKRPPSYPEQFTTAKWSDCPWQPHRERA